ncbi:MAG: hypothetical protein WAM60_01030 [Candidatus Promineifilaceae bacterium]
MFMLINNQIQTQFNQINRELDRLQSQRVILENQRTRLNLLNQFQQKGATRSDYIGFQPVSRVLFS